MIQFCCKKKGKAGGEKLRRTGRTHEEAARLLKEIEERAIKKPQEYRKKIMPYLKGDYVLYKDVTIQDFLELEIGVKKEEIQRFFHSSSGVRACDVENNPYIQTINQIKFKNRIVQVRKISFQKNELIYLGEPYLDNQLALQIPIGLCDNPIDNALAFTFDGEKFFSLMPSEINTLNKYIEEASGDVCVIGLGTGYFAFMCALKEETTSVSIVETNPKVLRMFKEVIVPLLGECQHKIKFIEEEPFDYITQHQLKKEFKYTFIDIFINLKHAMLWCEEIESLLKNQSGVGKVAYWLEKGIKTKVQQALIQAMLLKYDKGLSYQQAIQWALDKADSDEIIEETEIPVSYLIKAVFIIYKRFTFKTDEHLRSFINSPQNIKEILSLNTETILKTSLS